MTEVWCSTGRVAFTIAFALALAACDQLPFGYTDLRAIEQNPAQYEGKEVKVRGTVVDVLKLPIVDIRVFTLRDETGQLPIHTNGAVPALKQSVAVKGRVESAAIIGGQSLGLRVVEIERLRTW
jgi:cytochrome c-type biogenesis protein CcmE